jgi:hypothetical protein
LYAAERRVLDAAADGSPFTDFKQAASLLPRYCSSYHADASQAMCDVADEDEDVFLPLATLVLLAVAPIRSAFSLGLPWSKSLAGLR